MPVECSLALTIIALASVAQMQIYLVGVRSILIIGAPIFQVQDKFWH